MLLLRRYCTVSQFFPNPFLPFVIQHIAVIRTHTKSVNVQVKERLAYVALEYNRAVQDNEAAITDSFR